jgi:dipeptidyl-peptidase-3
MAAYTPILGEIPTMPHLAPAPEYIDTFKEIAVVYDASLPKEFNLLSPEERIFVYYIYRASLPGNLICTDQMHRNGVEIQHIFQTVLDAEDNLLTLFKKHSPSINGINIPKFMQQVRTYLVYLWGNHGQYFLREHADSKRTPERLGLNKLTQQNLVTILSAIEQPALVSRVQELAAVLFDTAYQATGTVPNNIQESAHNFYGAGFSEEDYATLSTEQRSGINSYFEIVPTATGKKVVKKPYAVGAKYDQELSTAVFWLQKALDHALLFPVLFDFHLTKSLEFLIAYLTTGDEELFKQHSIEWLQTNSRIDYCFGFIETYDDPKNQRGTFQAEATIRSITLEHVSAILPAIEGALPVDREFKRDLSGKHLHLPNASINTKIFGAGGLGPMQITAAYCLPNYEEIRSTHGSKQVIYPSSKSLGGLINPRLSKRLFFGPKETEWLDEHDHNQEFLHELWDIHCILHETLGHGSGKLGMHTCTADEVDLSCSSTAHQPGETYPVTSENLADLLLGYDATIEELRAEIIALYVSIVHLDELAAQGLLTSWYQKLGKRELQKWLMFHMLDSGLMRMLQQSESATEISGDHARANMTIMNYIIDAGGARIDEHIIEEDGKEYTVIALNVTDMAKALAATTTLLAEVQRIKSTGDGIAAKNLIQQYGIPIRNMEHFKQLQANYKYVVGDLKCKVTLSPILKPTYNNQGAITDIAASWPKNIFDQWEHFRAVTLSRT